LTAQARVIKERALAYPVSVGVVQSRGGVAYLVFLGIQQWRTPLQRTTSKAVAEAATTAPKPTPTISNWVQIPRIKPGTVIRPRRRPWFRPEVIAAKAPAPGEMLMAQQAAKNANQVASVMREAGAQAAW